MNQTWLKALNFHHKRLYPGQPTIDIEQLERAMKLVDGVEKNEFVAYSIKSISEEALGSEDVVPFDQLVHRITSTYKDTKDSMYLDTFFNLIDTDKNGTISYADLQSHFSELGLQKNMSEKSFTQLCEKLNHQSPQIGKTQFIEIIRQYI